MQTLSQQSTLRGTDTVTSDGETVRNSEKQAQALTFPCIQREGEREDRNIFSDYINIYFPP